MLDLPIFKRYTDSSALPQNDAAYEDFIIRRRKPTIPFVISAFALAFVALMLCGVFLQRVDSLSAYAIIVFSIIIVVGWFVVYITQSNRDLVLMTEFQNALFSSVANLHSLFLLIVNPNGNIVYYSQNYPNLFSGARKHGITSLESLLQSDGIDVEDASKVRRAIGNNHAEMIFGQLQNSEGDVTEVRLILRPLPRPKGFFMVTCAPMRRRATDDSAAPEETQSTALSASLDMQGIHMALQAAPTYLCIFNNKGYPVFIHPEIEHWLGYDVGEIQRKQLRLQDLVEIQKRQAYTNLELDNFEGNVHFKKREGKLAKAYVVQTTFEHESLKLAGCCTAIFPLDHPSPLHHFMGMSNSNHDASKQTVAASGSYLNDVFDHAPMGIALLDTEGRIQRFNSFFAHMCDLVQSTDEPINLTQIVPEAQQETIRNLIADTLRQSRSIPTEPLAIDIVDGEEKNASITLACLPASEDNDVRLVAHLIDTTEQKELEMRYAHSQKMQAVGQLAGGIAHDFNNLLTAMIGFCDLLLMRHPAGDQSFADIMQIKQNANRAANLVRQLLAFSRRQTLQPELIDVTDILAELSDLIRRLIGENIELNMVHGRDLGAILVDQGQFEQVVINLAVNARDAMSDGGTLTICTDTLHVSKRAPVSRHWISPADDDPVASGDYITIEVNDTGHGIPKDIITQIFEPFFSTKEVGSGTGLGLATVYGIIKQTGGHIFVKSSDDGTSFMLLFKRHDLPKALPNAEKEETSATADLTGKSTILLVEDEAPVRIFSARALRNKGYTVLEADCGEQALEIMESDDGKKVELIISDVIMPGIDGPAMVQTVWENFPKLNVIFISGYTEDALSKMDGDDKRFYFLAKPFTLKQLAEKVKAVTEKQKK